MKIKKGDNIIMIAGKDRGKRGKVLRAFPKRGQILVEGINIKKKSQRPSRSNQKGQIISKPLPIDVSNAMIIDPERDVATRVGYSKDTKGKYIRMAKKSGKVLN